MALTEPSAPRGDPGKAPDDPPPQPESAVAELLAAAEPIWWLVRDRNDAPHCAAFVPSPSTVSGAGWLKPAKPQHGQPATATLLGADGSRTSAPPPVDPYRAIELEYQRSADRLTLHTPRGLLQVQSAVLSTCRVSYPLESLPWFSSEARCLAARTVREPMGFGQCATVIPAFPFANPGPDWLGPTMDRGAMVFELQVTSDGRRCTGWRFSPGNQPRSGIMTSRLTQDITTIVTSWSYEYWGDQIVLLGPSHQSFEHGREVSSLGYGCGETRFVHHLEAGHSTVGGRHWYATKQGCELALPATAATAGTSGCR